MFDRLSKGFYIVLSEDETPVIFDSFGKILVTQHDHRYINCGWREIFTFPAKCCVCGKFPDLPESFYYVNSTSEQLCCYSCRVGGAQLDEMLNNYSFRVSSLVKIFCKEVFPSTKSPHSKSAESKWLLKIFLVTNVNHPQIPTEVKRIWLILFVELVRNPWTFISIKNPENLSNSLISFLSSQANFRK